MTVDSKVENLIKKNILIVDDHPFIIDGYKNAITRYKPEVYDYSFTQGKDCESGYNIISNPETKPFDIAFLDISMPPFEEKGIVSGEDLAKLLMDLMPNCKIILLTMYTELLKIKSIIETINPAGLVIKNDLTFDELLFGFDIILRDEIYYSHSVIKMDKQINSDCEEIDQFDKLILFHISKGTKIKDIPQYVPISLDAIESRKVNLKELFKIEEGSDIDLIREAKLKGIIF
ncbi:response regulator [Flavobacterium gilvum]|uniref:Response regulator n=1 Tax=Flavobacterium gilvum TaxID=1492737 RepID=A0AAC9I2P8_9FLAO|nr:response regulator [Flavobacterium gilvum]AOW08466.1 response regulator [Flavobacterium gilvum]KFC58505.1 histidine kinase [Flavobacterium gilvum]